MWYHFTLTVPAGTTESSPVSSVLKLTHGVIKYLGVGFPAGCKQLVNARVYHQEHQILPANPDEPASWDGDIEGGKYHHRLTDEPYHLVVKGYAPSATVAHKLTIFVNLLPVEVAEPYTTQASILDKLKTMFGLGG